MSLSSQSMPIELVNQNKSNQLTMSAAVTVAMAVFVEEKQTNDIYSEPNASYDQHEVWVVDVFIVEHPL